MEESSDFICLEYSNINFLLPRSDVKNSFYCNGAQVGEDKRQILFSGKELCVNNLDNVISKLFNINCTEPPSLILLFNETYLETSAQASVVDIKYSDFSLFPGIFKEYMYKRGIIAFFFNNQKVTYLINPIEIYSSTEL